jgi:hypothetical protein
VFTARYALSPYTSIKQIRFVFKGLKSGASNSEKKINLYSQNVSRQNVAHDQYIRRKSCSIYAMKAQRGRKDMAPLILSLYTRRGWVVNIILQPIYPLPRTPIHIEVELGGPQDGSGCFGDEKTPSIEIWTPVRPARSVVANVPKPTFRCGATCF